MIRFKSIVFFAVLVVLALSSFQCASTKSVPNAPFTLGAVYYQDWTAGVEGGGSGYNLTIPMLVNTDNIVLKTVYFRGSQAPLELKGNNIFVGRFSLKVNNSKGMVLSIDPRAEFGNEVPDLQKDIPFELKENEAVVSYKVDDKLRYFKIDHIIKKEAARYPKSQPKD